ncbi:hypothetical protein SARC_10467 [Sphaeroforma arctica JP610]|uniref:DNA-directed DNA polymerase n=1 Tax=Sphaeroforma arctica JP610 TaxID=667725 RepID=A0A0L0FM37_9EUKA|nr:hypothetical protein SARC_10467 [Sphaeroforma arctica JP610]KNC77063.1 hypothetical protein SARC_10467 [Sphaeroforma arctica JP610]|eukprot:XP_014150965.1 hypothetical protein SARC_10467 [Sphaeroforma arctica JP610]
MYFEKAVLPDPTRGQYGPFFNDRRHPEFRKKQHDFRINKSKPKVCDTGYCEEHKLELTDPVLVRQHRIAVYDFETMQENWVEKIDSDGKKTKEYRPFTVNAVAMSHLYADEGQDEPFTRYWCGENALTEFVEFIRTRPSDVRGGGLYYRGWQFLAHNGSRFDTCFIRKYCISNNIPTAGLETGRKIRSLALSLTNIKPGPDNGNNSVSTHRIGGSHVTDTCWSMTVTFVDSMDFIATGLAKFPKMFGLKCDAKGYFPHQLNTRDHQNVKMSTLPDIKYYGLDDMSPSYAMDVETWHRKNRFTSRFDLQEEMKRYCINDVIILCEGLKVFIDAFVKLGRVHPLGNLTIAGACMSAYESTYLPKEIMIEHTRPKPVVQTSKEAVTFFSGLNQMIITGMSPTVCYFNNGYAEATGCKGWGYGIPLNADLYRNARYEYRVTVGERTFIADCYLPAADGESGPGTIIEFNGCYWHGCRDCNIHVYNEGKGEHERRYVNTLEKEMTIRAEGFEFIPVWACKARKFIRYWTHNNITDMVGPTLRIDPRESMAGGRTEPFASLVEVAGNGRCTLHYVDFTSLYPYVNAFKEYPCGPMTTLVKDLLIPVLPYKSNRPKKLSFGLCAACMLRAAKFDPDVEMFQDDEERSWIETYTSVDIKLALEYGNEFPNVYEINMYEGRSTVLFKDYMSSAIQMKIKASKPPAGTREEQEEILDWYRDEMGMTDLSLDDIELNEGMRNTSKIIVNSLWGKFGQRAEYPDKKLFTSYEEFAEHRERYPDKKMVDFRFWEEVSDVMEARFKTDRANIVKHSTFYQPQLAAFTTSHGRDVLYRDGIAKLHPTQIVYCDTDSIVCIYDRDNPNHKEPFCPEVYGSGDGFILGTMKDELEGKVMKRFYSLAPKTYAYEKEITAKDKAKVDACQDENTKKRLRSMFTEEIKSKGFSLSRGCVEGEGFNVDSFKEMVLGNLEEIKTHVEAGLYRSMDLGEPRVRSETKVLKRPEFIKRKLLPMENHKNYSILRSVPWGYVEQ